MPRYVLHHSIHGTLPRMVKENLEDSADDSPEDVYESSLASDGPQLSRSSGSDTDSDLDSDSESDPLEAGDVDTYYTKDPSKDDSEHHEWYIRSISKTGFYPAIYARWLVDKHGRSLSPSKVCSCSVLSTTCRTLFRATPFGLNSR